MSAYIKNTERSQINALMLHLKLLDKQEQAKPKTRRRATTKEAKQQQQQKQTKNPPKTKNQKT
jgi:hypothetical protein